MLEQLLQSTSYVDTRVEVATSRFEQIEEIIMETLDQEDTPKENKKGDKEKDEEIKQKEDQQIATTKDVARPSAKD